MNLKERFYDSKPTKMTLQQRFYDYLVQNKITEFTTRDASEWYAYHKSNRATSPDPSNLHYMILNPLQFKGLIKRVYPGQYVVLGLTDPTRLNLESKLPGMQDELIQKLSQKIVKEDQDKENKEDKEFFDYIQSKIKGGL